MKKFFRLAKFPRTGVVFDQVAAHGDDQVRLLKDLHRIVLGLKPNGKQIVRVRSRQRALAHGCVENRNANILSKMLQLL